MNLRDLEYLVAVDEELHFNRAARRCFVSQPTLSGQLKKLEDQLGVLLVERSNRQVFMTDAGKAVATQARRVLAEAGGIKEIAQAFLDPMAGELHVGLIPTVAPYLLPLIIPVLKKSHPRLKLWLYEHQTAVLLEKLRCAQLDLLILALPVETDEFSELDILNEAFWLAVPADDTLANNRNVDFSDLQNREMLLLEEGHCLRGQALDVCFTTGATENTGIRATSLETLRHMVAEGLGLTLIPELAIPKRHTKKDTIRYLPFTDPKPSRRIGMLFRKGSYREETFQNMINLIKQNLQLV